MRFSIFLLLAITIGFFWQCTETKEVNPEELGSHYFPLKSGEFRVYKVEGTQYISSTDSMEFSYFLKESVANTFEDLSSGVSYKILRERKSEDENSWETDSIWTARKDEFTAVLVENNTPKVKLSFPVVESKKWDGNNLNGINSDEYEMINVGSSYQGFYETFAETLTVLQEVLPDLLVKNISQKEVYAKNIGLVYKENIILNYKQGDDYGLGKVESGIRYFQNLMEYGEE